MVALVVVAMDFLTESLLGGQEIPLRFLQVKAITGVMAHQIMLIGQIQVEGAEQTSREEIQLQVLLLLETVAMALFQLYQALP